jgi:general secretion pathway protein M
MALPRFLDRLNARERRLVSAAGVFFGVVLVLAVPIGLESVVHARESDDQELAAALTAVQEARGQVRERQEKKEALLSRYARKAPPLAGFLEQAAQIEKLEVENSDDRPEVPHGKRYVERSTNVHLKKSGLLPIVKFLEAIEKSGYPMEVSRLSLRKRSGENDSYDVEVGVTAYDRADATPAPVPMPIPVPPFAGFGSATAAPGLLPAAPAPGLPVAPGATPSPAAALSSPTSAAASATSPPPGAASPPPPPPSGAAAAPPPSAAPPASSPAPAEPAAPPRPAEAPQPEKPR